MPKSLGKNVLKGAGIVSFFLLLGKAMVFVQKLVIADRFGTGMEADAFTLAFSSIIFAFSIIPLKVLAPVLPLFAERREKTGAKDAWRFASTVGSLTVIILAVTTLCGILGASHLVGWASNFSGEKAQLTTKLVRLMFPATFFLGLFALLTLIMHAYKRFTLPALGETLNRVMIIVVLIVLFRFFGIVALALGVVAGAVVCVLLQLVGLRHELPWVRFSVNWRDPSFRELLRLIPPVIVAILIAQGRTILDFWFTSGMGQGYTSSLSYAKGLSDTMIQVVPFAIGVVIYPFFSDMIAAGDKDGFTKALMNSFRMMAFFFIPISAGFIVLGRPIIQLAFERGQFTPESVTLTAGPFFYYALGLTWFALEIILMRFYFAMKDTWTPAWVGLGCVLLHVAIILATRGAMLHQSVALAAALSKCVKVILLFILLKPMLSSLQLRENALFAVKTLVAAACMAVAVHFVYGAVSSAVPVPAGAGKMLTAGYLGGQIGVAVGAGLAVFAGIALALRTPEAASVLRFLKLKGGLRRGEATT